MCGISGSKLYSVNLHFSLGTVFVFFLVALDKHFGNGFNICVCVFVGLFQKSLNIVFGIFARRRNFLWLARLVTAAHARHHGWYFWF